MMSRTDLRRHLHDMVDHLFDKLPDDWLEDGVYPTLRVTFGHRDDDEPAFTLVVGLAPPDKD